MHSVIVESLEEYLAGTLDIAGRRSIEVHLDDCEACREELAGMREISYMFGSLRSNDVLEPAPGFYAGVMQQVQEFKPAPSLAGLFSFDFAFGRRLVFASLITMAILGTYLVTRESDAHSAISPNSIMAQQDSPGFESAPAHDSMLVTLAAYGE